VEVLTPAQNLQVESKSDEIAGSAFWSQEIIWRVEGKAG
jgi:hypothetical protein